MISQDFVEQYRLPTTTSVAVRLIYQPEGDLFPSLILVTQKQSGLLGLIAGGLEKGEKPLETLYREAKEEADLSSSSFVLMDQRPEVLAVSRKNKSSVGLAYDARLCKTIASEGYIPNSTEISLVKPYTVSELIKLLNDPSRWYYPEFNLYFVTKWIIDYIHIEYEL